MSGRTEMSGIFGNFWEKVVDHFEDYEIDKEFLLHKLALICILTAGIIIRLFSLIKGYDIIIKAFDPYVQFISANYIERNGFIDFVHWVKNDSWYPFGFHIGRELYWGVPISAIVLHWFLNLLTFNVTMQQVAYFIPVIYGGLTIIASYYLGKETISSRAGLLTALFMSILPSYASRSVAGFFDNEYIGILFVVLSLYFFLRALKRDDTLSAFLAGICLAVLMGSWGAYRYVLDLLPLCVLFLLLSRKVTYNLIKTYTITNFVAISLGFIVKRVIMNKFFGIEVMIPILMIALLIFVGIIQNISRSLPEKTFKQVLLIGAISSILLLSIIVGVLLSVGIFDNIAAKFWAVIIPRGRVDIPIINSVSEHQPMPWGSLFRNFHILTFFMPLGIYYCLKKPTDVNIFILVFGVSAIYFTGSMIRLVLLLAPAASLLSALAIDRILYPYSLSAHGKIALTRRKVRISKSIGRDEAMIAYIVISLLLLTFVFHCVKISEGYAAPEMAPPSPYGNSVPMTDWQDALAWLRENAQGPGVIPNSPSVVLSWWDYGYWITNYGNATTLVDNATTNKTQIGTVGTMLMWNLTESIRLMYRYNVKYVLVNSQAGVTWLGSDLGKSAWCIRIAEADVPHYGIKESDYIVEESDGRRIYAKPFYESVLYRLSAYDKDTGFAFDGQYGPTGQNAPSIFAKASDYPVKDLKGPDGHIYFTEVYRSYGLGTDSAGTGRAFPGVRIYEVIYPPNIAQLAAELDMLYPKNG